ncbi:hypothetical protein Taro_010579, partial [Colocasia esculenta]|nr:hypothetical protein [Colocasia esculenta]
LGCAEAGSGQQGSYVESYGRWRAGAEQKEPRSRACVARAEALAMGATWLRRNRTKICWAWRFGCAERSSAGCVRGKADAMSRRCAAQLGSCRSVRCKRRDGADAKVAACAAGGCDQGDGARRLALLLVRWSHAPADLMQR